MEGKEGRRKKKGEHLEGDSGVHEGSVSMGKGVGCGNQEGFVGMRRNVGMAEADVGVRKEIAGVTAGGV